MPRYLGNGSSLLALTAILGASCDTSDAREDIVELRKPATSLFERPETTVERTVIELPSAKHAVALRPDSARPYLFGRTQAGVVVVTEDQQVHHLNDSTLTWRRAALRPLLGPRAVARDVKSDATGRIVILDGRQERLLRMAADLDSSMIVPATGMGMPEQVGVMRDGRLIVWSLDRPMPFFVFSGHDSSRTALAFPWEGYSHLPVVVRQGLVASDRSSPYWVFAFSYGDGWIAFKDTVAGPPHRYVEHVSFPPVIQTTGETKVSQQLPRVSESALSVSVWRDTLYVLFVGVGDYRRRALDVYHIPSGRYLRTYVLPARADRIVVGKGRIYALKRKPTPVVDIYYY